MVEEITVGLVDDVRLGRGGCQVVLVLQDGFLLCSRHLEREERDRGEGWRKKPEVVWKSGNKERRKGSPAVLS